MTVQTSYKGETFLMHTEVLEKVIEMVAVCPLSEGRLKDIRHDLENEWINVHIKYGFGLVDVFTDEMSEFYIHRAFESLFLGNSIN